MKKTIISVLLLAAMMAAALLPTALAETAKFPALQHFMEQLDAEGFTYEYKGIDDDGDERVCVGFDDDGYGDVEIYVYFTESGQMLIRAWNLVNFSCGVEYACSVVNTINADYKFIKMYVDTSDNSVTASMDLLLPSTTEDYGETTMSMFYRAINIIGDEEVRAELAKLK